MTAAYRMRGLGWFLSVVVIVLGFYLVSLQVAAERKKVDDVNRAIAQAKRDIRSLETEFNTRANLAQLEKWNGEVLALQAPTADQFVADEATLAMIDFNAPSTTSPQVRAASYVVPSLPEAAPAPAPAETTPAAPIPAPAPAAIPTPAAPARQPVRTLLASSAIVQHAPVVSRASPAPVNNRPTREAVALLDRQLLSDSTLGDLMNRARSEATGAR